MDELVKSEGFDRPQIFVAEDISRFKKVVCADSNCKISESAGDSVTDSENDMLATVRRQMSMTDPLYIIYTSGSTGNPKGVMTSHLSLMTYINAYCDVMHIEESDVLGNQSPLDYIAAIRDIYLPLKTGCSTAIIPKEYFTQEP